MTPISEIIGHLEKTGDLKAIYAAIDTYDMAHIVKTVAQLLVMNYNLNYFTTGPVKSRHKSAALRNKGNEYYKAGQDKKAIESYNQALALAPKSSEELMLAYGNRSAVFFRIRYISACINDINICLSMGCSDSLSIKLRKRLNNAYLFAHEEKQTPSSQLGLSFFNSFCKRNADVPCASDDITFEKDGTKQIVAARDIDLGKVVAVEKAYATSSKNRITSCYFCQKMELSLHPCDGCVEALFCSESCKVHCFKEYHNVECPIMDFHLMDVEIEIKLMTITVIKLVKRLGWNRFIAESENIGASRMRTNTAAQTFNCQDPLSILSYEDNKLFLEGRMFNGSIVCSVIMELIKIRVKNFYPKNTEQREKATDALARVMMKLYTTVTNTVRIMTPVVDYYRRDCAGINYTFGWFSMCSKLKHSCEPNLYVAGLNNSVSLVTMRPIKKGEDLTISFIKHYYVLGNDDLYREKGLSSRQMELFVETQIMCSCRVCNGELDTRTFSVEKMSAEQAAIFMALANFQPSPNTEMLRLAFTALGSFERNTRQHKTAYVCFIEILASLQSDFTRNICIE